MGPLGPGMAGERRIALELLERAPGDAVLDIACGPGNFVREFAGAVGRRGLVVGLERVADDAGAGGGGHARGAERRLRNRRTRA